MTCFSTAKTTFKVLNSFLSLKMSLLKHENLQKIDLQKQLQFQVLGVSIGLVLEKDDQQED